MAPRRSSVPGRHRDVPLWSLKPSWIPAADWPTPAAG